MEILRGGRRLANLNVVARRQLQKPLDACAGMLRPLPFVSVRKQQHDARQQIPLVFARRDELVDDDLRPVREITELSFPQHERFGIIAAESVFESHHARFGKRRIVNFAERRFLDQRRERYNLLLRFHIDQRRMALIERAAPAVLPRQPHRHAFVQQRAKSQRLGHSEIDGPLAVRHFPALLQQLFHLGMNVKSLRIARQRFADHRQRIGGNRRGNLE